MRPGIALRVGAVIEPAIILDPKEEAQGLQLSTQPSNYNVSRQQGQIWTQVSVSRFPLEQQCSNRGHISDIYVTIHNSFKITVIKYQ